MSLMVGLHHFTKFVPMVVAGNSLYEDVCRATAIAWIAIRAASASSALTTHMHLCL